MKVGVQFVNEDGREGVVRHYFSKSLRVMAADEEDALLVRQCLCYNTFCLRYKRLHGVSLHQDLGAAAPGPPLGVSTSPSSVGSNGFSGIGQAPSMDVSTESGAATIERIFGCLDEGENRMNLMDNKLDKLLQMFQAMVVGAQVPGEAPQPTPEPVGSLY